VFACLPYCTKAAGWSCISVIFEHSSTRWALAHWWYLNVSIQSDSIWAILSLVSCQGMALDRLQARNRLIALYERYGTLLTEHQREVLDLYLRSDWSLAEIASSQRTSRAAVHDLIRRSTASLSEYERRLGLLAEA